MNKQVTRTFDSPEEEAAWTLESLLREWTDVAPGECEFEDTGDNWRKLHLPSVGWYENKHISLLTEGNMMLFVLGAVMQAIEARGWSARFDMYTGTNTNKYVWEVRIPYTDGPYLLSKKYGSKSSHSPTIALLAAYLKAIKDAAQ